MYGSDKKKLTFGLDFDDTVTRNIPMFKDIVDAIIKNGGDVYIVTARAENGWCEELRSFVNDTKLHVIFSSATAKQDVAEIDIWIDDFPLAVTHHYKETHFVPNEQTQKWVKYNK
jgi:hypothetical protein